VPHVGDVHHVVDLVPGVLQGATQEILVDVRAEIPDVRVVVHRGTAAVHPHFLPRLFEKRLFLAGKGIVELQGHIPLFEGKKAIKCHPGKHTCGQKKVKNGGMIHATACNQMPSAEVKMPAIVLTMNMYTSIKMIVQNTVVLRYVEMVR
jgi:hypothetical protein